MNTLHVQYADESFGAVSYDGEEPPTLPVGATVITEIAYQALVAAWTTAHETHIEQMHEAVRTSKAEDVAALAAAGIPLATAERLLGLTAEETEAARRAVGPELRRAQS
ncbi:hypothetical protein HUT18_11460 [Streptomyces sp. NA04227]|uniref:hypothetical protein n=1 Tax=Streptomyces sp. NA04227 TaxID=2742136 RepID=UPI00158FFB6B|nr:hypothetical protein [Streptomyces sp. NA04227]QKW06916.1 hypothetical protein HUT18_11460 [Streptomyces sp. NA04227]